MHKFAYFQLFINYNIVVCTAKMVVKYSSKIDGSMFQQGIGSNPSIQGQIRIILYPM